MDDVNICCNVNCSERFSCACFSRALDVNAGKILKGYRIIECKKGNYWEKA